MKLFIRTLSVIIAAPLLTYAADLASAPHLCVIAPTEDFTKATISQLTGKLCGSLLMAKIASEEATLIDKRLSSRKWDATNKKEWADIMARGMFVLAERDLCINTAVKVRDVFLRRFEHEPQCSAVNKK